MSEFSRVPSGESKQLIDHETVSLANGPIDLYLARTLLQIVDPNRDLDSSASWPMNDQIGCFIIDPSELELGKLTGCKAIRDGEKIVLGRDHTYKRFTFNDYVSREHVEIFRDDDTIHITDRGSTNGTFLIRKKPQSAPEEKPLISSTPTLPTPEKHAETRVYNMAGETVAADYRPDSNEDAFFIDADNRALGVFDGVGGVDGSEAASALAVESVEESLKHVPIMVPRSIGELAIREALENAHEAIIKHGGPDVRTTAIIAKVFETESGNPYAMIGSAGDSRAYLIRDTKIEHVTLDHVFAGGLSTDELRNLQDTLSQATDLSKLTDEERGSFIRRNLITSCLGGEDSRPTISITDLELQPDDQLLLTSDGIHDNLTNTEIEEIIHGGDTDVAVHDLILEAQSRSRDNSHVRAKSDDMTAVMLTYRS